MDSFPDVPFIFSGDFNSEAPSDVDNVPLGSGNHGSELIKTLLGSEEKSSENHIWKDTFRELNPDDYGPTFEDDQFTSRLDYIFVNEFFADKLVNSSVRETEFARSASDHIPLQVTFNMNPELADLRPPFRVANLDANVSETNVEINWGKVLDVDASYYTISRDGAEIGTLDNTTLNFDDTTVEANTIYRYRIKATDNSSNHGRYSKPLIVNTSRGVLTTPGEVTIQGTATSNSVSLTWSVTDDGGLPVLYYMLFRTTDTGIARGVILKIATLNETSFVQTGMATGKNFHYVIIAVNELGIGLQAELTTFHTPDRTSGTDENPISTWFILPGFATLVFIRNSKYKNNFQN